MSGTTSRILLVDDDETALYAVSLLLRKNGYEVFEAGTGAECLRLCEEKHPDLILLDIMLPDINGVEVLKQIRATPRFSDIFVVHLSAQTGSEEKKMEGKRQIQTRAETQGRG